MAELDLGPDDVYDSSAPLGLGQLWAIHGLDRPDLHEPPWVPMTPPRLATAGDGPVDLFSVLRERDVLVHHPYDSFTTSVEAFITQAADDPNVLAIKQTLYRTSDDTAIVSALVRAAEQGKQVAALVEVKARFDEQANIIWARQLERAGVHVVYGLVGLKTHSKIALVVRREEDGLRRYCHIGTGNYNSETAKVYEDLGLLTSDPAIGEDLTDLFNHLTGYGRPITYRRIVVAPQGMRPWVLGQIAEEAAAERGGPDHDKGEWAHRPGGHRRVVRCFAGRRPDRSRDPRDLQPSARGSGAFRSDHGPLDHGSIPGALPHLPVRRPQRRAAGALHDRLRRPDGAEPRPPDRGARSGARPRATGSPRRDDRAQPR